ncbi:MAG TPA: hypothetical protein VLL97_04015 [Acidobacteriota bacterium]|nr:hypothetical protein [Acidobacteriota bacterium]
MAKRTAFILPAIVMLLLLIAVQIEQVSARDVRLKPADLLKEHLASLGRPETVKSIQNRSITGAALVQFVQGGTGRMAGQATVVSANRNLGIGMTFSSLDYPGEYFAFDGKEVTAGNIRPGQRSPIADFLYRYNVLVREGLVGGALSLGWSLLHVDDNRPNLRYNGEKQIEGRVLHELEYRPRRGASNMTIHLYFDPETYRHVRTVYRIRVRGEMGLQADAAVRVTGLPDIGDLGGGGGTRAGSIHDAIPDSIYVLTEKFENFNEVEGLTLPHTYIMEYSVEGQGSAFLANWTIIADQWIHNNTIDSSLFRAPDYR